MVDTPIPVDLVTCSEVVLTHIFLWQLPEYQIPRLAKANNKTEDEIRGNY